MRAWWASSIAPTRIITRLASWRPSEYLSSERRWMREVKIAWVKGGREGAVRWCWGLRRTFRLV